MTLESLQLVGIAAVILAVLYAVVRWVRKQNAIFPDTAKKYGIVHTHESKGGFLSNTLTTDRLRGVANGTSIEVISTYQTRGRMRMRSTVVAAPAAGWPPCTINIERRPPAAEVHLVPTGDAQFDRQRWVTSDAATAVRVLLTPTVRAALLRCPQEEIRLVVNDGHFALGFGGTPTSAAELHGLIDAVLALPRSKTR
jgi:hypothetical protein